MAYEMRDNSGSLWPNDRRTDERYPNSTGKVMVGGKIYYLSGWTKTTSAGKKWISLSLKPADETAQADPETGDGQADNPGF